MKHKKEHHIVFIITKLELGGAQKVCLSLFKGLQNTGIRSTIISGATGKLVDQIKDLSNVILLNNFTRELSLKHAWDEASTFFKLIRQLQQLKKQSPHLIVHTHSTKAGIIGRWAAWFAGIKIRIHTIHGYGFHEHQNKFIWLCIYLLELVTSFITTHYVCVSSKDVKTGIKLLPRFAQKHSIIRAAVDWKQFYIPARKTSLPPSCDAPFIFGTIACFKPQKNLFDLLKAFAQVHHTYPNTRLEIIGDGTLRSKIENWISQQKLNHAIILHGWQETVAPIMLNWNAFVLSSLWEGLPCAIIEARLLKLPVISYNTGGIRDVIFHDENGLLYKQGDWPGLARGMQCLIENKSLYTKLADHSEMLHDFKKSSMLQEHCWLYQKLKG